MCAPTRAMLLSGNNNHVAGVGRQHASGPVQAHLPGYEGHLSDRIAPLPRLLHDSGYHTYIAGKWHLGSSKGHSAEAAGFERSFNLVHGAANHFDQVGFFEGGSLYREDGEIVAYPAGRYSTEIYTDRLLEFINADAGDGRPFFAFAAYTSPHWPLQVPDDELDRYAGCYEQGYERLREERFASLKAAGIVPQVFSLPPSNPAVRPWAELSGEQRKREARKMQLYAAMVENLDHHVGRLVAHLRSSGRLDETFIVFMSDNGPAGLDFYASDAYRPFLREHYDNRYENMGRRSSWVSYGVPWAEAGSAPFSRIKSYTRQGGIVAPMIVAGPGVERRGEIVHSYVTVMDIAPTLLELAGASYPTSDAKPMLGTSLVELLAGRTAAVHDANEVTTLYHRGVALIRRGDWKLVTLEPPFDESKFELFDLASDPGETRNLASEEPERYREMLQLWRERRHALGIVLPDDL